MKTRFGEWLRSENKHAIEAGEIPRPFVFLAPVAKKHQTFGNFISAAPSNTARDLAERKGIRTLRKTRIQFEGALYHVIVRGNQRRNVFWGPADHKRYLGIMGKKRLS